MNDNTRRFIQDTVFDDFYNNISRGNTILKSKISPDISTLIGYSVIRFQDIEEQLIVFVATLIGIQQDRGLINALLSGYSFKNRVATLEAVATHLDFPHIKELRLLLKKAIVAEEIRNGLIHSIWHSQARLKPKNEKNKGISITVEKYTTKEIREIITTFDKIDTAIRLLLYKSHGHERK